MLVRIANREDLCGRQLVFEILEHLRLKYSCLNFYFICIILQEMALSGIKLNLSHHVASGSEITSCNKIDKPLVVYRFSNAV